MECINQTDAPKPKRSKEKSLNPFWNHKHTEKSKKAISDSQKERYAAIRKALQLEKKKFPLGRTDKLARMDLLNQCLHKDTITFDTVEQAFNFVAIMMESNENYLQKLIKEELNKFLNDRIDTPSTE